MKKSKVFIGTLKIANVPYTFAHSLRENSIKCDYYTWSNTERHPFGYNEDKYMFLFNNPPPFRIFGLNPFSLINKLLIVTHLFIKLYGYNTFIFIGTYSFFKNNLDLPIIKLFRKKIIFIFTGCPERDPNFNKKDPDYICNLCIDKGKQENCSCNDLVKKKKMITFRAKYSYKIIGQDDITNFVEDKNKLVWLYLVTLPPDPTIDYMKKFNEEEIRILHFPSNPLIKQTHVIMPILQKFLEMKNVKIIIKEGVWSRDKIYEELTKSHILINALGTGYNTLPIEAMSRGCVVLNSYPEWFKNKIPDAPVYEITADSLYNDILFLLDNREILKDYAKRSIDFYYRYHTPEAAGKYYINNLGL